MIQTPLPSTHMRHGPSTHMLNYTITLLLCAVALPLVTFVGLIGLPIIVFFLFLLGGPLILFVIIRYVAFEVKVPLLYHGMLLLSYLFTQYNKHIRRVPLNTSPEMQAFKMIIDLNRPKLIKHFDLATFRHQVDGYRIVFYIPFHKLGAKIDTKLMRGVRCIIATLNHPKELPEGGAPITIVYLHGGGFVAGCPDTFLGCIVPIAQRTPGCGKVVFVDYRKAPEYPLPAAVDDAEAVYRECLSLYPDDKYVFMGDSAGGALAILALLRIKECGSELPQPMCGVAFSPYVDLTTTSDSWNRNNGRCFILEPRIIELAHGFSERVIDRFTDPKKYSPVYMSVEDLRGLPPLYISASIHEPVIDEVIDFTKKAREAGIRVLLETRPHMPHVYSTFWMWFPEGNDSMESIIHWMSKLLRGGSEENEIVWGEELQ